ncbi:PAS domain S-box protein [Pontibacter sp. Tf4]|uniref:PAS domain-containing sensor histidine kinase n=1 Tax=Pontibacter sp. Tf4 TaxID=2761620 RepID=UPI00162755CA|nr:PAS domain S-box protein [Pontibacter sp. Tf4]MBB6610806.1 PAS domain S-box protein [Pontibacter sp. Tf4]
MKNTGNIHITERLLDYSPDLICCIDRQGRFIKVNEASKAVLGYESAEMEGQPYLKFVAPEDRESTIQIARKIMYGHKIQGFVNHYVRRCGKLSSMVWSAAWSNEEDMMLCIARTNPEASPIITTYEVHKALAAHGSDVVALLDEAGNLTHIAGSITNILGYVPEQLTGTNIRYLLHSEDAPTLSHIWQKLSQEEIPKPVALRLRAVDGTWRRLEVTINRQVQDSAGKGFTLTLRHLSESGLSHRQLEENEQKYRALFYNNPDVIFFEDRDSNITEANEAFSKAFDLPVSEAIGKPAADFLPADMAAVNKQSFLEALRGSTLRFDLELRSDKKRCVFDTIKFPVTVAGQVAGIQTIAKDITPIVRSFETIERQAGKLNTILNSITDAFFALDHEWRFTYANSVFLQQEGYSKSELLGKSIWEIYPKVKSSLFYEKAAEAFASGEAAQFEESFDSGVTYRFSIYPSAEGLSVYYTDITGQMKTQQELRKLSLVASHTTNGVIIADKKRRIEWVNEGFTRMTGYTLAEAVGKRRPELLQADEAGAKAYKEAVSKMKYGKPVSLELLNYKKNGEELWLSVQINPILDEQGKIQQFITIQTDITERVKSAKELEKLSLVAKGIDNSVVITDAEGRTEWVNEGFTRNTGYTLAEMLGKNPGALLSGPDTNKATIRKISQNLKKGVPFTAELLNYKKSGEKFWVSMDITPFFDEQGCLTKYISIQRDITYRKEAEEKQLKMTRDLYQHNKDLQQFTYIVSHNLRAPVANALGLAHLLTKADRTSEAFDATLSHLKKSVLQMDTVLKDVNTILSVRSRKDVLEKEEVKFTDVFGQVYAHLQEPLVKCGGEVQLDVDNDLTLYTNKAYLYSIFHDLLSNAIKYRSQERLLLVKVSAFVATGGGTVIQFSDNGMGFDTEKAGDNVFGLYKRFHIHTKGRGLGLFLVKTSVEALGGTIEVESQVDVGTNFMIYLP